MIKAVIFDMGNVLVRFKPEYDYVWKVWEEKVEKHEEFDVLWWDVLKGKMELEEFNEILYERKIFERGEIEKLFDRNKNEELNWELIKLIKKLKKKFKTGLLTNNFAGNIDYYRGVLDNYSIFDAMISSHEVGMVKPDREIYFEMAKRLGCKLSECVFVDNLKENIEMAKKLGMKGVVFKDNVSLLKGLKKLKILAR